MRRQISLICIALTLAWLLPAPAQQAAQQNAKPASAPQGAAPAPAQGTQGRQVTQPGTPTYHFESHVEIVRVDLQARDSKGALVRNLTRNDITVLEDGKPQNIITFDLEDVDNPNALETADSNKDAGSAGAVVSGTPLPKPASTASSTATASTVPADDDIYKDHRLFVLYLDLTTMQPEDVQSAIESAEHYVKKQMMPADLVGIATLGNTLTVNQDFTSDKDVLINQLEALNPNTSSGFADGGTGTTDGTADDGNTFAVDDTEFNVANADRSLEAVQSVCDMLKDIQQKKSILFVSDGITRSGLDNEITERSAVNSCVKSNSVIYALDARGLQANVPGGNATSGSIRGSSAYTGQSNLNALASNFAQQETLSTLANDTGGDAFLDSNDFAPIYTKIQKDTESYYLISYHSNNPARDGKYRKIVVKVNRPDLKLNFKPGYNADKDFNHLNTEDRMAQLQDELDSPSPEVAIHLYAALGFLRLDPKNYWVPVSVDIPGADIPLKGTNPKATPTVDVDGVVLDQLGHQIAHVQDTIHLDSRIAGPDVTQIQNKNVQYQTGFKLSPGQRYQIKFAARENQTGGMGAFATILQVPDLDAMEVKTPSLLGVSSVLVGNQLANARPNPDDPLTASGKSLVESVTNVFTSSQHLLLYYEIYNAKINPDGAIRLRTNVAFYRGKVRTFQSSLITTTQYSDPHRKTAVIQLDIPLSQIKPGYYTCQINVLDEAAQKYAFPRVPIYVRAAPVPAATASGNR